MSKVESVEESTAVPAPTAKKQNTPVQESAPGYTVTAPSEQYWKNISEPLLRQGEGVHNPDVLRNLGPLAVLIGTWVSTPQNGYNVMPIPQATAKNGFILKNHSFYEEITFSAIADKVANRGGKDEQDAYTLFYEQRVYFSDGPQKDKLVHAENGAWLHLIKTYQGEGAVQFGRMPAPPALNPIPPQDPETEIVKQVSVPHGNSILANGSVKHLCGAPEIPDVNALPVNAPAGFDEAYGENIPGNPNINPNAVLQETLKLTPEKILNTVFIDVDTARQGNVVNIPYIRSHINVSGFSNQMWLEYLESGEVQMQYTQNITLDFPQDGKNGKSGQPEIIKFPHIVVNTLRKKPDSV